MSTEEAAVARGATIEGRFQLRRLGQLILASLVVIGAVALQNFFAGFVRSGFLAMTAMAVLLLAYWAAHKGRLDQAASLFLGTLTLMVTAFMWLDQGLRDHSLLGYCGILIFAAMLSSTRLLILLLGFMLLSIATLGTLNLLGWYVNPVNPLRAGNIVDAASILAIIGFGSWLISSDLRRALYSLEEENQRVRQTQAHIQHLAGHDPLTGLVNRLSARDRFEQALAQARRNQTMVALLFLDLDNFKTVNDSLGHAAGDELLRSVAEKLQLTVRQNDTVCRQGGDEFLLIIGGMHDSGGVARIALKVLEKLGVPTLINGQPVLATCSVGIAMSPNDGDDFDTLMQKADLAMYQAKASGRNVLRFYSAEMNSSVREHLELAAGMREALVKTEFMLYYQPQYNLQNGSLVGAEALIRWRHPTLGLVSPATFIPIAEKTGMIIEIGAWVLQEACRQTQLWREQGLDLPCVSVNLSPIQFRRGDVERVVLQALENSGLPPAALQLELTESLLIEDSSDLGGVLNRLRAKGVGFSIDDFGTGYSNLGYLKRFAVEYLKIDQSFVRRLVEDPHDEAIVQAIIQMAHSLKLELVAEGIEDAATLARLVEMGCDYGQGFYWSPALPPAEFQALLQQQQLPEPS